MKDIEKLKDPNLSQEEIEKIMENLLYQKFEQEKIEEYQRILREKYGVERIKESAVVSKTNTSRKYILAGLFALALATLLYFLFSSSLFNSQNEKNSNIHQYVMANPVQQIDIVRGEGDGTDEYSKKAAQAFAKGDFTEAIVNYKLSSSSVKTNTFYLAYSLMRESRFKDATLEFEKFISSASIGDPLYAEARVFEIINLLQSNNLDEAESKYNSLSDNSWEKNQLKSFFD